MTYVVEPLKIKASVTAYFVMAACLGVPFAASALVLLTSAHFFSSWLVPLVVSGLAILISFIWLSAFRLAVDNKQLIYSTLFSAPVIIPLAQISRHRVVTGFDSWTEFFQPQTRLEIFLTGKASPTVRINLKVFSGRDVSAILKRIS